MSEQEVLKNLCLENLKVKVSQDDYKLYLKRLINELIQIEVQEETKYFLELYNICKKYDKNQNNLIVPWLLNICPDFNISEEANYKMGELPDIDIDYLPQVRDYLKNEWAINEFGREYVCNIGNYGTFGLKSTFIDMARVHGLDRGEILNITKQLRLKDDEGHALGFDKALELYPELKIYCEKYPDIALAVQKLLHRNRSMGRHAGGLIISSERIDNFVPLAKNAKDETCASAWGEGLHGQDLSPVGLIKMDMLVIDVLNQIALACKMIKERHDIKNISANVGEWDWSDLSYLNDEVCLKAASDGDLKGIFQFDGEGIRNLARHAKITSFDDLAALNALYRPGCLLVGMDKAFANRKNKREDYEIHPLLKPILGKTYGVILYQEQVMQVLNVAGSIPLRDCYQVLKAISKKKGSIFEKYKNIFLENGKINLGYNDEEIKNLYDYLLSFSEYGFNKSHAYAYTYISARQLFLKSYYPIEFFCASLITEKSELKAKEMIVEANKKGIEVLPISINTSTVDYAIQEGKITIGFSNIKGIGVEKAERIVATKPYIDLFDFLQRYGSDANVLKSLIALNVFAEFEKDKTKEQIYIYWLKYCYLEKNIKDKIKRNQVSFENLKDKTKEFLPSNYYEKMPFKSSAFQKLIAYFDSLQEPEKYKASISGLKKILKSLQRIEDYKPEVIDRKMVEDLSDDKVTIDKEYIDSLSQNNYCEEKYYGFIWKTNIETSPDFIGGYTVEAYNQLIEDGYTFGVLELEIEKIEKRKGQKNNYYQVTASDFNCEKIKINIWMDDYEFFKEELKQSNLIKIQLEPPSGGFPTYSLKRLSWEEKRSKKRTKSSDFRIVLMRKQKND